MLSNTTHNTIQMVCRIGHNLGAFPLYWNTNHNTIQRTKSKLAIVRWILVMIYTAINTMFMSIRLVQAACYMEVSYGRLFLNLFSVITFGTTCGCHWTMIHFIDDIPQFFSHLVKARAHFELQSEPELKENLKSVQALPSDSKATRIIAIMVYTYSLSQFFIAIKAVDNPKYFYSLWGLKDVAKWKLIPFGILECYMSASAASNFLFYIITIIAYADCTRSHVAALRLHPSQEIPRLYRIIQLLNKEFTQIYTGLILPLFNGVGLFVFIISSYATLRLYSEVKGPAFLGFPMLALADSIAITEVFPVAYHVGEACTSIIRNMTLTSERRTCVHKVMKSCWPVRFRVSNFYFIDRGTTIAFVSASINYTVTLLLTY